MRYINSRAGRMLVNANATRTVVFPGSTIPDAAFGETSQGECHIEMRGLPRVVGDVTSREKLYVMRLRQWALKNGLPAKPVAAPPLPVAAQLPSGSGAVSNAPTGYRATANVSAELRIVMSAAGGPRQQHPAVKDKFSLLKDIGDRMYCDLIGEVRRTFYNGNQCVIYFTDYTENFLFYDYSRKSEVQDERLDGDPYSYTSNISKKEWHGPFGKMTMQIRLWAPHDDFARENVNEGDIIFLRNTNVMFKQGKYLEGNLRTDQKHPGQVDIREVRKNDPRLAALHQRRLEYWALEEKLSGKGKKPSKQQAKKEKRKREKEWQKLQKKQKLMQANADADEIMHDTTITGLSAHTTIPTLNPFGTHYHA
jgi:hypothetical protein